MIYNKTHFYCRAIFKTPENNSIQGAAHPLNENHSQQLKARWRKLPRLRRCAYRVAVVANFCEKYLIERNVAPEKITVIHNGMEANHVASEARANIRKSCNIEDDIQLIGVASRLDPVKGLEYLLAAFLEFARLYPRYSTRLHRLRHT